MLLRCPYCEKTLPSMAQRVAHLADAAACPQRGLGRHSRVAAMGSDADEMARS